MVFIIQKQEEYIKYEVNTWRPVDLFTLASIFTEKDSVQKTLNRICLSSFEEKERAFFFFFYDGIYF